jgi:transposase
MMGEGPVCKATRNIRLYEMVRSGVSQTHAAKVFGISQGRAHQIYKKYHKRAMKETRLRMVAAKSRIQDPDDVQQTYKGHWIQASWI